ncbi:hypothetical protein Tco_1341989 [Tanacetum coccineum]
MTGDCVSYDVDEVLAAGASCSMEIDKGVPIGSTGFGAAVTPSNLSMQRNVEYPRALLHRSIAQDIRTTTKRVV